MCNIFADPSNKTYVMNKLLLTVLVFSFVTMNADANNYTTPNTGVKWNLDNLVTNSGGDVTFSAGQYFVNDTITISVNDTLSITNDATVKFFTNTYFYILGNIIINPPTGVLFTPQDINNRFYGMYLNFSSGSIIRKMTMEYASALRLADCSPTIDSCIFRNNTFSTSLASYAISLFRSNAIIKNCTFIDNYRPAIGGGANIDNGVKVYNCYFKNNCNTAALNQPQINLGGCPVGDTIKIIGNTLIGGQIKSGVLRYHQLGEQYGLLYQII